MMLSLFYFFPYKKIFPPYNNFQNQIKRKNGIWEKSEKQALRLILRL